MLSLVLDLGILVGILLAEGLPRNHSHVVGQWLSHFMILLELKNLLSNSLIQLLASVNKSASNECCHALVICHEGLSID